MDPATGFIFCQYRDANKRNAKKCNIPVHKDKPEPFCNYHVKRLQKQHNQAGVKAETNGVDHSVSNADPETYQEAEAEAEEIYSDQEGGLDDSGSGEETSPPRFLPNENVVIN